MSGHPGTWFVVLPDIEAPTVVAAVQDTGAPRVLHHPSGRPWLLGDWPEEELVVARAGSVHLAVLGRSSADPALLHHHAELLHDRAELAPLAARLAGSHHLLASIDGTVHAHGSLSGLRRLHHTQIDGIPVAADRADVLARLAGLPVATERLALRLLHPLPPPLDLLPLWTGIEPVRHDHLLLLAPDRPARTVRRWRPPTPELPAAQAAERLGAALDRAVAARTAPGGLVAADLSGGLDSTPLSFLAARGPAELLTVTVGSVDPHHDDARWADQAAEHLPGRRLQVPADALPAMFAESDRTGPQGDEPFAWTRTRARDEHLARELAAQGARLRITGEGGDEVLQVLPSYLRQLLLRRPALALGHLRAHRARLRWTAGQALRGLADSRSYPAWLASLTGGLDGPQPPDTTEVLGWGLTPRLPPWATPEAAHAVREQLKSATGAEPLAPEHAQHQVLHMVRHSAGAMRLAIEATGRAGAPYTAPFLDDQVLEACLAAELAERGTPFAYKPLLVGAMAGIVPEHLLRRPTKGDFSPDAHHGLERHRRQLAELTEHSALARAGLVDPVALRQACTGIYPPGTSYAALDATLACEHWLRAHTEPRISTTRTRTRTPGGHP